MLDGHERMGILRRKHKCILFNSVDLLRGARQKPDTLKAHCIHTISNHRAFRSVVTNGLFFSIVVIVQYRKAHIAPNSRTRQ